jgi:membrane fusion protein (multidrug efflux system)
MKLKTLIAGFGIVGAILLVIAGLFVWKRGQDHAAAARMAQMPKPVDFVQFARAETGPFQRGMTAVGTIQAIQHITIANEVVGKVVSVGFESGQVVRKGDVLLTLDSATEQADLRSAEAEGELARASYERWKQAMESNAGSKQELDRARAEQDKTNARIEQIKAVIEKKQIRAPFDGRVGLRDTHPGQYLAEGTRITTLQGIDDKVFLDFSVPQARAAALPVGASVKVNVLGQSLMAPIVASEAQIDLATRNARLRATLPSLDGRLVPGMFVDVEVPLGESQQVVKVPTTAVRRAPFGDYVFMIVPDPKDPKALVARQKFVQVAGSIGSEVVIADGVKPGDLLAADGSFKLRDGGTVMEAPPAKPVAAAPAGGAATSAGNKE